MTDWTLEKYHEAAAAATNIKKIKENEQEKAIIVDNIIEKLDKKRDIAINKKKKALLKDEVSIYRLGKNTIDFIFL